MDRPNKIQELPIRQFCTVSLIAYLSSSYYRIRAKVILKSFLPKKDCLIILFLRFYLFIFRERGREGENQGEKHLYAVASCTPPTGDPTYKTGMHPDWELNQQPLASQTHAQYTKLHQPGLIILLTETSL